MRPLCISILLFVVFIIASAKADEETREFTLTEDDIKIIQNCANEAGYKESDLKDMHKYLEGNADTKFKCFLLCLYKGDGIINNGQIDEDKLIQSHHAETTVKLKNKMLECAKTTTGSDDCELAYNITKCISA